MIEVIGPQGGGAHLDEALGIVRSPALLHLAIFPELVLDQVILGVHAHGLETSRCQEHSHAAVHVALAALEHCLYVPHHRLEILALVQEHSIPVGHLVLPVLLPLAQGELLEELVRRDYEHRRSRLEAHTALYAYDCVSHVHIATYSVRRRYAFDGLYGFHSVIVPSAVDSDQHALFEFERYLFASLFADLLEICLLRQPLAAVQNLAAADGSAPESDVIGIFQLREVGREAVRIEVIDFVLARQSHIPRQGYDFHIRRHYHKGHIEAHLVVAGACRAVRYRIRAYLLRVACDGHCLEYAFRRHRNRICSVAEHVAIYHIFNGLFVIFLRYVEGHVFLRAEFVGVLLVLFELLGGEAARIGAGRIYLISLFVRKVADGEGGVQTAAEGHDDLFRRRAVEHSGAEAAREVVAGEHVVVDTAFAALPEGRVRGEVLEGHGNVAQFGVDFHHCRSCGQTEDLRVRETAAGELEGLFLDGLGESLAAEFRLYDESGVGHEFLVVPAFYVTESRKDIAFHRDYGLAFAHFLFDIFGFSLGYASASYFCRVLDGLEYLGDVGDVLL